MPSNKTKQKNHDTDLCRELKTNISSLNGALYSTAVTVNQIKEMSNIMQARIKLVQENLFGCETNLENYIEISRRLECAEGK